MGNAAIKSEDIRSALKLRYPPEQYALMFEVAPRTGGGTRYADAVSVGLWASHGHAIEGFEIKVSRSDFLNEMKQPEKSEPVMRYCDKWWLVAPKGMVTADELPTTWGLLELHDKLLRVKVKAPQLSPVSPTLGFFASLCRRRAGLDEAMTEAHLAKYKAAIREQANKEAESARQNRFSREQDEADRAVKALARINEQLGIDLTSYQADDQIIQAIRTFQSMEKGLGWECEMSRLQSKLAKAAEAFAKHGFGATP